MINQLFEVVEAWSEELEQAIIRWLGTYLMPANPPILPCPSEQDFFMIIDQVFDNLPPDPLLAFLQEGKTLLNKTLESVRAANLKDPATLTTQNNWVAELERRLDGIDLLINNVEIEEDLDDDDLTNEVKIICPICMMENDLCSNKVCSHYICSETDGNQFSWVKGTPHFYNEVGQLNHSINRIKTEGGLFETVLAEVSDELGELFRAVRKNGSSYWVGREAVVNFHWETDGCGTSCSSEEYFHHSAIELISSIKEEAMAALEWLETFHPEILVQRGVYSGHYEDSYWGGSEE